MKKYGYFDEKNKEYVITRPDTPTPWINYLGSDEYCALISNTAGGYSFHKDPRDRRILRYRYNNLPSDRPGRYLYVRDNESGDFWSLTWQPVLKNLDEYRYECRHGLGYTKITSLYSGIESEVLYFVPLNENLEICALTLKNKSQRKRNLTVFSYLEFCLWQAVMDMNDFQYTLNIARAGCDNEVIYHTTNFSPETGNIFAFFASSEKTSGFDCNREKFIGPYRSESNPLVVEKGKSFNSAASGGNPIASLAVDFELSPDEEKNVVFVLGVSQDRSESDNYIRKYKKKEAVEKELNKLKEYWEEYLTNFSAHTPDDGTNLMVNTWNQYQCRTTFNWSRSASYYEAGIGRGMGFRDSNQDVLGVLHAISGKVRARIKNLAKNQFDNGSSFHQYFPLTGEGDKRGYSDDHLWLIISTADYIKETGDLDFLKEEISYAKNNVATGFNLRKGTLYEHLKKALDYTLANTGVHGLPLIGFADWNDCLNLGEKGESVWVAQLWCKACREFIELAQYYNATQNPVAAGGGLRDDIEKYSALASKIQQLINNVCWDRDWYIRAFASDGKPVGSSSSKEGKIYLNTQSWAVFSGIAEGKRAARCMDSVRERLNTEHGIMLVAPPYTTYDPGIGAIGTFAPGLKENGGIFCHSNPWAVIAECMLGRGDTAFEYYKKIAPTARNEIADIHKTECYVYSQFITGREHPNFGMARNSWLTGSATWNLIAVTNYILGIRPAYEGLLIDPCIPKSWDGFTVQRRFRGAIYEIDVANEKHVCKGVSSVLIDGKEIASQVIPAFSDGKVHRVKVIMG